ncbi:MAG: hypothetical protein IPG55_20095 [Saprospiraceae bacterium]|nr:hypothetical protein [Candidatus Defluviibacterium haderslevense]
MNNTLPFYFTFIAFILSINLKAKDHVNLYLDKSLINEYDSDIFNPEVKCEIGSCEAAIFKAAEKLCFAHIDLAASATDNETLSDDLVWSYKIDLFNNGQGAYGGFDIFVGAKSTNQIKNGDKLEYQDNSYADSITPFKASGSYPIGLHRIRWIVRDQSGNIGECEKVFEIKDCKAPTPYCITGGISVTMPSSKCVDIWTKDLNHGSYDNCSDAEELKFYFERDKSKSKITICCDDFVAANQLDELRIMQEITVEDESGNVSFCNVIIYVQDKFDHCVIPEPFLSIKGKIVTEHNEEVRRVNVQLESMDNVLRERIGSPFFFGDLTWPREYTVTPFRNDEPLNGVSTADIVKIQKHILGQSRITSPYKLIAADVNNSGAITASDISEMRKLILGVQPTFTKVSSWKFVPSDYVFPDSTKPYSAPRKKLILGGEVKEYISDFIGIKMGDITGNTDPSLNKIDNRTSSSLNLVIQIINILANQTYKIPIRAEHFEDIDGFQFTMKYDAKHLVYQGVEPGVLSINNTHFGDLEPGVLTSSWNSDYAVNHEADEVLFYLIFNVVKDGNLQALLDISNDVIDSEAYGSDESTKDIHLNFTEIEQNEIKYDYILFQNEPNPFKGITNIRFQLPDDANCHLIIYDLMGQTISQQSSFGKKGMNEWKLIIAKEAKPGVMFYKLVNSYGEQTRRMIQN